MEEEEPTFYRAESLNSAQSKIGTEGGYLHSGSATDRNDVGIGIDDPARATIFALSSIMQGFPDTVVKSWPYTGDGVVKVPDLMKKSEERRCIGSRVSKRAQFQVCSCRRRK